MQMTTGPPRQPLVRLQGQVEFQGPRSCQVPAHCGPLVLVTAYLPRTATCAVAPVAGGESHHLFPGTCVNAATEQATTSGSAKELDLEKDVSKIVRQTAATFAPRSSTATKNPAVKGSLLYNIFEWQAWICLAVGGLLSFNVLFPTDDPSIPRLMG